MDGHWRIGCIKGQAHIKRQPVKNHMSQEASLQSSCHVIPFSCMSRGTAHLAESNGEINDTRWLTVASETALR